MMGKPGPKLKAGARYENGRLMPVEKRHEDPPALIARKAVMDRQAKDSKWGSTLGRMYLDELVTSAEMNTGFAYARFRARFDVVMGLPRRSTQAMCYGEARHGTPRDLSDEEVHKLRERHSDMLVVASNDRGLLDLVCCEDRQPAAGDVMRLRKALKRLSPWFGVDGI